MVDGIRELTTQQEWIEAYSVMNQLRTHLDLHEYLCLIKEAAEKAHYRMAALFKDGKIAAVTGFMPMVTLYHGNYIWVCDLVTDLEERSKGYGAALLDYVENWAAANGYPIVSLSSGLQRLDAHRFYQEKMTYDRVSYVFLKRLT